MSKIVILDEKTANQIAAGEVIERPASVVKEMVENAIDAGATAITVEIKNGGVSYIRITDNGSGMEGDDVEIAFERHATSKIRNIEDLDALGTMGFRGEALASIASVSHLEVRTKTEEAQTGTLLRIEGGKVLEVGQAGCPTGTTFTVRNLFFNTPARYKFLKKDTTEAGYVTDMMERLALSHPQISFKLIVNGQVAHHTPGNNDLISVIYSIYGKDIAKSVIPVNYHENGMKITGFIGKPEIARGNRNSQSVFINGRFIRNRVIASALEDAYKTILMQHKFPFCVLRLEAAPETYDVNVHPQKLEVRFSNDSAIYSHVYHAVKNALLGTSLVREYQAPEPENEPTRNASPFQPSIKPASPYPSGQIKINHSVWSQNDAHQANTTPIENTAMHSGSIGEQPQVKPYESRKPILDSRVQEALRIPFLVASDEKKVTPVITQKAAQDTKEELYKQEITEVEQVSIQQDETTDPAITPMVALTGAARLLEAQIVGQAFDTYIILQHGEDLLLIDQHAAHERIRYETLKKGLEDGKPVSQTVMEPYIVKLTALEHDFVMKRLGDFERIGFEVESFGPATIMIRSIPAILDGGFGHSDFQEILDRWIETSGEKTGISDEALYMMSCKSALKANRTLYKEEINGLVETLATMENPYTCVHGRPVIITLSKKELEKRFKRIV